MLLVSAADKLHNTRAIVADLQAGCDVFARFKGGKDGTLWYYDGLVHALSARMGKNHPLIVEFRRTTAAMHAESGRSLGEQQPVDG
jgi:hypothetical protein